MAARPLFERLAKDKLPNAWLFTRDDGKPWAHSDWDGVVRAAAAKAGLETGVCLYTLRHSFITQALMDGMSTLDVARITGTSLAMIEQHYGHLVMTQARERLIASIYFDPPFVPGMGQPRVVDQQDEPISAMPPLLSLLGT